MREFKFRAWFVSDKFKVLDGQMCSYPEERNLHQFLIDVNDVEIDHGYKAILMQFTGLKDQNGVEIYEGDILESPHFKDAAGRSHTLKHIVQWSDKFMGWFLLSVNSMDENDGSIQLWITEYTQIEVVGNIHQHPELLGKAE